MVGMFPGLGSRAAYRNLGPLLRESGIEEVTRIYHEAAGALGIAPEHLQGAPEHLPSGRLERQGHVGALVVTHSLALEAYLRATAERNGAALTFRAYTGESFGILSAAVASGSLSVADGARIARVFTPLSLVVAEGLHDGEPLARELAEYVPESAVGKPVVPEPFHVLGVRGAPDALAAALEAVAGAFDTQDVEVHKRYSPTQTNVYVRDGARRAFDRLLGGLGHVDVVELKEPTTFLAHSARMEALRTGLGWFMEANGIQAVAPRVPVIANHRTGVLTAAEDVHEAVLAMTDQVMDSHATVETLDSLHADLAIELGPGRRSVTLLQDSNVRTPVTAYTGTSAEARRLFRAINGVSGLKRELEQIRPEGDHLEPRHLDVLRALFRSFAQDPFIEAYTARAISRVITREMLRADQDGSPAYYRLLEAFQHTLAHRAEVDVEAGELVLRARRKKRNVGDAANLGRNYLELRTVDGWGTLSDRCVEDSGSPETLVVRFTGLPGADEMALRRQVRRLVTDQPLARMVRESLAERAERAVPATSTADRITYHHTLYHLMRLHRPAVLAQRDRYLRGDDPLGWLSALAVSGAATPADVVELYELRLHGTHDREVLGRALDRLDAALQDAQTPVIAPDGVPLYARRDIATATRSVFLAGALDTGVAATHLAGDTWSIAFDPGAVPDPGREAAARTVVISSDLDVSKRGVNTPLDRLDDSSALELTVEKGLVLHHAQGRRILSTTVNAYIETDERVVGFGAGGSESMTVFLVKDGSTRTVVRKILSEALVTAAWRADGEGVMLPPFAKARQQAEFLRHLPEPVSRYFPEVYDVLERELPVPGAGPDGPGTHHEVIYEMSFVAGDEVSRYVERHSPPPRVVAKIYQAVYQVLERDIHAVNRVPAPGGTLDESYLRKIEDRLDLCRRTAPQTFGPQLLDPETITINGHTQRNATALVRWFREHPEYHQVLEPRFHSLVMGDTNTENIKISHTGPLRTAQDLIEHGASRREVDAALAAITPTTLGIKFLDPRAIGYRSTGRETIDDPMYDNKPWHNSIGHYDEIHFEHFQLDVRTSGTAPQVRVEFDEGNPFQRAYRVRDVVPHGLAVHPAEPRGMEDHFAAVMTEALGLDDPASPYLADDPYWLVRFVFMMGTHFTAMPPFHFQAELDGTLTDTYQVQRRPVAIYCEGVKWLNWAVEILEGERTSFLGIPVPALP
ncbi:ACP S-malonyltransferase [Myceligenerans sp. I2]|uniref:[acyl-carrier-protein] S-malonyltransferase n=1 Tax=Myceligenerans indicum TaxID=2593663 RepID=A0ABS1LMX6_9MICO|nr:ACP S-malonyltransferase [Myceligenerans indicum]